MTLTPERISASPAPQWQRFAIVFAVVASLLLAAYFLILRAEYSVLFEDMNPSEASLVISELETMEVRYRVAEAGRTIEVPAAAADEVRLKIAGSTSAASSLVGFELFNESDMGMTEFAQKIKYQRAIQGELARSILLIEGIDNARVHIAVPERSTFRNDQAVATASVTLVLRPGASLTAGQIDAIQHLIAASVPTLTPDAVTILDQSGHMIAATTFSPRTDGASTDLGGSAPSPESAVAARLASIVAQVLPGSEPDVVVSLPPAEASVADGASAAVADAAPAVVGPKASARIVLISEYTVSPDGQAAVQAAAVSVLPPSSGAASPEITFLVRQPEPPAARPLAASRDTPAEEPPAATVKAWTQFRPTPLALALASGGLVALLGAVALGVRHRRQSALSRVDRREFADLIKSQIALVPREHT